MRGELPVSSFTRGNCQGLHSEAIADVLLPL